SSERRGEWRRRGEWGESKMVSEWEEEERMTMWWIWSLGFGFSSILVRFFSLNAFDALSL
ncbi:hypothetical protein, partial [Vibrio vulnificus]|uniref:hypothetical protein n=1 Tax=Vibrio vulnificus TaxID=672 RepID=UPI0019D466D8